MHLLYFLRRTNGGRCDVPAQNFWLRGKELLPITLQANIDRGRIYKATGLRLEQSERSRFTAAATRSTRWAPSVSNSFTAADRRGSNVEAAAQPSGCWHGGARALQVSYGVLHQREPRRAGHEYEAPQHGHIRGRRDHVQVQVRDARERGPVEAEP